MVCFSDLRSIGDEASSRQAPLRTRPPPMESARRALSLAGFAGFAGEAAPRFHKWHVAWRLSRNAGGPAGRVIPILYEIRVTATARCLHLFLHSQRHGLLLDSAARTRLEKLKPGFPAAYDSLHPCPLWPILHIYPRANSTDRRDKR